MSLAIKASQTGKPVGVLTGYAVLRRYSLIHIKKMIPCFKTKVNNFSGHKTP